MPPLSDSDIRRIWGHEHPTQMPGNAMHGLIVSTYLKAEENGRKLDALLAKVNEVSDQVETVYRVVS